MRNLIKEIFTVTYVWWCLNESVFYGNKSAIADLRHSYVMHIIAMESMGLEVLAWCAYNYLIDPESRC